MADEYVTIRVRALRAEPRLDEDGNEVTRVCRLCSHAIDSGGDWIDGPPPERVVLSKLWGTVHADCYVHAVEGQNGAGAWAALGYEVANRPSHYKTSDIRAVINNLLVVINRQAMRPTVIQEREQ